MNGLITNLHPSTGRRTRAEYGKHRKLTYQDLLDDEVRIAQEEQRNKDAKNAVKGYAKEFIRQPSLTNIGNILASIWKGYINSKDPRVQGGIAPAPGVSKVSPSQINNAANGFRIGKEVVKGLKGAKISSIREGLSTAKEWAKVSRQDLINAINKDLTKINDVNIRAKLQGSQRAAWRELTARKQSGAEAIEQQAVNVGRNRPATINVKNMSNDELKQFIRGNDRLLTGSQKGQAARDVNAAQTELNAREAAARAKQATIDKRNVTRQANKEAKIAKEQQEAAEQARARAERAEKYKATRERNRVIRENKKYEAELKAADRANKAAVTKARNKAINDKSATFEHNGTKFYTDTGEPVGNYDHAKALKNYNEAINKGYKDYTNGYGRVSDVSEYPSIDLYGRHGSVTRVETQPRFSWQSAKEKVKDWNAQRKANNYNTLADKQGHDIRLTTDGKGNFVTTTKQQLAAGSQPQTPATTGTNTPTPTTEGVSNTTPTSDNAAISRWDRVKGHVVRNKWKYTGAAAAGLTGYAFWNNNRDKTPEINIPGQVVPTSSESNTSDKVIRTNTGSKLRAHKYGGRIKAYAGILLKPKNKPISYDWKEYFDKRDIKFKPSFVPSYEQPTVVPLRPGFTSDDVVKDKPERKAKTFFKNATKDLTINDAISTSMNLLGSGLSAAFNKRAIKNMKAPSRPSILTANKLKTKINVNPQLDEINNNVSNIEKNIDAGTVSSSVALARKQQARLAGMTAKNNIYSTKESEETKLINQDRLNQQTINNQNVAAHNDWINRVTDFNNTRIKSLADNRISLVNNVNASLQDILSRGEKRTTDRRNLIASLMPYRNVSSEELYNLGLISKEQRDKLKNNGR